MLSENRNYAVIEAEKKYKFEESQKEIISLQLKQLKTQRVLFLALMIIAISGVIYFQIVLKKNKQLLRANEEILGLTESLKEMEAISATNQILAKHNMTGLQPSLSQEEIRMKIINTYEYEFNHQALRYMFTKRWNTFLDVMGGYGAIEKNKIIPVPSNVLINYPGVISQNPGY
ncbi:hypothetical protein GGR21_001303 [Dysgonomonas hofstadii]|uniref:Uncharacterized protein n=1 Tax=Dysgonomonas hofstadii TaxID=637886 RepID=A0A840CHI2_9BACT|nr:hypothetical protein [Dysgonomonas hofstadii]MBB4035410.1 hypothetical protein [Dysgonomonas hofstadii]